MCHLFITKLQNSIDFLFFNNQKISCVSTINKSVIPLSHAQRQSEVAGCNYTSRHKHPQTKSEHFFFVRVAQTFASQPILNLWFSFVSLPLSVFIQPLSNFVEHHDNSTLSSATIQLQLSNFQSIVLFEIKS
jgi:hypothetical protein